MDKHYLVELLNKYLKGEASEEEKQFLIAYYNLFELEPGVEELLSEEKKKQVKDEIRENIWKNIEPRQIPDKKTFFITPVVRVAAAVIAFALCSAIIFFGSKQSPQKQGFVSVLNKQKENRLIHLPDGSTAIVNIGSKLTYPPSFDNLDKREVYLEGEAFFDISHNPSKPFIVHTGSLQTTVLGTAFNIKALPADLDIEVTVTRGKVKVSDSHKTLGLITKGEEIVYDKKKGEAVQKTGNSEAALSWKHQDLFFDDVTVEDALKLLKDRFDVTFIFNDQAIKTNRFTTVFLKNENIEQVLKSICEFNGATYQYNKQTSCIIISKINNPTN